MSKLSCVSWGDVAVAVALLFAGSLVGGSGFAPCAWAGPGPAGDPPGGAAAGATSPAPSPNRAVLAELGELKRLVEQHVQKIDERSSELDDERAILADDLDRLARLESELGAASLDTAGTSGGYASPGAPAAVIATDRPQGPASSNPAGSNPAQSQNVQTQGSVDKRLSNLEARLKQVGPLSFSGDFRFREEPSYGGPTNGSLDQNRLRYRVRFNTDVDLGAGVTGGFTLASGDVNNPISTNQDITAFYTRKPIEIDKAFVQYNPTFFHPLTVEAGKFAYPWFNTELTWDKDLNPEGVAESLAFNLKSTRVLKRVALIGFELPFAQVSGVSLQNQSLVQSVTYGGQVQTVWQITPWATLSAFEGFYDFEHADPIALALAKANSKNPVTPLSGVLPLSAGSTTQNSIVTTTAAGIVTVNGTAAPTGATTITNAQFNSKFALLDSIAKLDFKTPWERWPITLIGNFVQNTEACANEKNILAPPANTATATYSQSANFACNARQRHGYWGEAQVGRIFAKHDLQLGYTRIVIEREAVLSNFDYSEIRQGANVTEHRASAFYTVRDNVVFDFIALIGRPLNESKPKLAEPFLDRFQFDVNYAF